MPCKNGKALCRKYGSILGYCFTIEGSPIREPSKKRFFIQFKRRSNSGHKHGTEQPKQFFAENCKGPYQ
jgi:hypothetical protein